MGLRAFPFRIFFYKNTYFCCIGVFSRQCARATRFQLGFSLPSRSWRRFGALFGFGGGAGSCFVFDIHLGLHFGLLLRGGCGLFRFGFFFLLGWLVGSHL